MAKGNPRKRSSSQSGSLVDHFGAMEMSATTKSGSEPSLESEDLFTNEELFCWLNRELNEMLIGKKKLGELRRKSYFCDCCLKPGHLESYCPCRRYAEPGQPLGRGWVLLCRCCEKENCQRPWKERVFWRASQIYCINKNCKAPLDHRVKDCPYKLALF